MINNYKVLRQVTIDCEKIDNYIDNIEIHIGENSIDVVKDELKFILKYDCYDYHNSYELKLIYGPYIDTITKEIASECNIDEAIIHIQKYIDYAIIVHSIILEIINKSKLNKYIDIVKLGDGFIGKISIEFNEFYSDKQEPFTLIGKLRIFSKLDSCIYIKLDSKSYKINLSDPNMINEADAFIIETLRNKLLENTMGVANINSYNAQYKSIMEDVMMEHLDEIIIDEELRNILHK